MSILEKKPDTEKVVEKAWWRTETETKVNEQFVPNYVSRDITFTVSKSDKQQYKICAGKRDF